MVVVAALVATVVIVSTVRASLPSTSGTADLPGLTGTVTVMRDGSGIPHIFGDSLTDLARAQGYVHAQEQFFQMDLRRHITAGRLSELVGKDGIETDKVIRTLGWRRIAEEELPTLKPQTRQMLQAYADGVNTYLRGRTPREVALEYTVLGLTLPTPEIEEWQPVDSLSWLKAMAWDLKGNYDDELARARLSGRLTAAQISQIYPPYDAEAHPPILGDGEWSPQVPDRATQSAVPSALTTRPPATTADAVPPPADGRVTSPSAQAAYARVHEALTSIPQLVGHGSGVGSNSWVVSGARSTTGKPLLANDPHLGVSQPGVWIQNSLSCRTVSPTCPMNVSGYSFAGVPGVVIGHNADIAWGFTNLGPDVSDFYLERVIGDKYLRDGNWQPVTSRQEVIKVAGGADESVTVRSTVHGPVLSDVIDGVADAGSRAPTEQEGDETETYAVSLAWTGLLPGPHRRRDPRPRPRHELRRLPRGGALVRGARAEPALRRPAGPHRLPGTRPGADPPPRPAPQPGGVLAGAGLGLDLRLAGVRRVLRAAVGARPARRRDRGGEPGGLQRDDALPDQRVGPGLALDPHR